MLEFGLSKILGGTMKSKVMFATLVLAVALAGAPLAHAQAGPGGAAGGGPAQGQQSPLPSGMGVPTTFGNIDVIPMGSGWQVRWGPGVNQRATLTCNNPRSFNIQCGGRICFMEITVCRAQTVVVTPATGQPGRAGPMVLVLARQLVPDPCCNPIFYPIVKSAKLKGERPRAGKKPIVTEGGWDGLPLPDMPKPTSPPGPTFTPAPATTAYFDMPGYQEWSADPDPDKADSTMGKKKGDKVTFSFDISIWVFVDCNKDKIVTDPRSAPSTPGGTVADQPIPAVTRVNSTITGTVGNPDGTGTTGGTVTSDPALNGTDPPGPTDVKDVGKAEDHRNAGRTAGTAIKFVKEKKFEPIPKGQREK